MIGFSALLNGAYAACLDIRSVGAGRVEVVQAPTPSPSLFGGPLTIRATSHHDATGLDLDLSHLDRGTAAHESILTSLVSALALFEVQARGPGNGMPSFDAGWAGWPDPDAIYIAEAKSLTGTDQAQQRPPWHRSSP